MHGVLRVAKIIKKEDRLVVAREKALSAGGCDRHTKHGQEELLHVRGQGQKLGGPHARTAAAKRSYSTSEVRGRSWEDPMPERRRPRGATPHPRSGAEARSSYPASEVRGSGGRSHPAPEARGFAQRSHPVPRPGPRQEGATPRPRSGGCAGTGGPRGAIPR